MNVDYVAKRGVKQEIEYNNYSKFWCLYINQTLLSRLIYCVKLNSFRKSQSSNETRPSSVRRGGQKRRSRRQFGCQKQTMSLFGHNQPVINRQLIQIY